MKTNILHSNSIITKYICLFLMVIGINVSAWGAGQYDVTINNSLTHCSEQAGNPTTFKNDATSTLTLYYTIASGYTGYGATLSLLTGSTTVSSSYYYWHEYSTGVYQLDIYLSSITIGNNQFYINISCPEDCIQLDPATNLSVNTRYENGGKTYVKFSWTLGSGTDDYADNQKFCYGPDGESGSCTSSIAKDATSVADLRSKLSNGKYWWSIQALGSGDYCDSEEADGYFCIDDVDQSTPSGLSASSITLNSASLSWNAMDDAEGYAVTIKKKSDGTKVSGYNEKTVEGTSLSITGLSEGTTYKVEIFAYNACADYSNTNSSYEFTTLTEYAITLDGNGGDDGIAGVYGNATALHEITLPTRSHYTVEGYYTDDDCTQKIADDEGNLIASISVSETAWTNSSSQWVKGGDATFYTKWTPVNYTISFNANGGSGSMDDVEKAYNETYDLPACTFTRPVGKVFDHWAESSSSGTSRVVGYTHTVTDDITFYAVWKDATYSNYRFSCADIEFTGAEDALVLVTSSANNKVRSQEAFHVTGSGLPASTALTFSSSSDKFEFKTASGGAVQTDANGEIDTDVYAFYTPEAGDTNDGLDEPSSLQVAMTGTTNSKRRIASLNYGKGFTTTLKGRHLPANFVIAAKSGDNWYALPADKTTGTHDPIEIVVDNATTPTQVLTPDLNVYTLYGQTNKIIGDGYGQYIKLAMHGQSNAPLAGQGEGNTGIGKSLGTVVTNDQTADYWWALTQTNASVSSSADAKYNVTVANGNTRDLKIWFNAGGSGVPKWGLYNTASNMVDEIRLIPYLSDNMEAEVTEWTDNDILVEASPSSKSATKVSATIDASESSKVTLADATAESHTLTFDGQDFAGHDGDRLTLNWYNSSDELVAVSWIEMPSIIATEATTWGSIATTPTDADIVVLKGTNSVSTNGIAKRVIVDESGKLDIPAGKALVVAETVKKFDGTAFGATGENDINIGSTLATGNGALVMGAHNGTNKATVNFAIKAYNDATRGYVNQYIGTPFNDENDIQYNYYGSWVAKYVPEEGGSWAWIGYSDGNGNNMVPFMGYNILRPEESQNIVLWMQGTLNSSTNQTLTTADAPAARLCYNGSSKTQNLLANSWMAPIDISKFDVDGKGEDDFTNVDATIYIFNAGSPKDFTDNSGAIGSSGTSPGQYTTIPVNDRPSGYNTIPSMQAFIVLANAASPSITLDYNRLVYTPATSGVTIEPNKAPARTSDSNEPIRLSIRVQGESGYSDNIRISERADFTTDFDQGWEGRKLYGVAEAPQLYVMGVDKLAIAAVPEMEGTLIGLKAGEADNSYTFTFEYEEAEALYLLDTYMNTYTRVQTGARYTFATPDKNEHNRFILTHRTPSIATEVEPIGNGQGKMDNCRKVLMEDHIYIIRGGRLYDATGKLVNNATEEGGAL